MQNCCISASRTSHSGLQVRCDQVVNDDGGKSVAKGLVALANAGDVVTPDCTDDTSESKFYAIALGNMHEPPNSITFSQKFANDVRANETRGTSDLQIDKPVRAVATQDGCVPRTRTTDMMRQTRVVVSDVRGYLPSNGPSRNDCSRMMRLRRSLIRGPRTFT